MKNMACVLFVCCTIVLLTLLIKFDVYFVNVDILAKNEEKELTCYKVLAREDFIEDGCEKYFIHDKWYIDYMKDLVDSYE